MDRDTEIAEIRRELDILRARHALFAKWGRVMPGCAILAATAGVVFGRAEQAIALILATLMIVFCAIVYFIFSPRDQRRGWIDLASPAIGFAYPPKSIGALFAARPSDALIIEEQIAEPNADCKNWE